MVSWPFEHLISPESYRQGLRTLFDICFTPFRWLFAEASLSDIRANMGFQQGYTYSFFYTIIMLTFGYKVLMRWRGIAHDKRYQTYRYISLLSFQLIFFLIVNIIGVKALTVQYSWRMWGLYQPFPLFFNTFFWWYPGDPVSLKWLFIGVTMLK